MLDFARVTELMRARDACDCGQCDIPSHIDVASPIIGQLMDPELHGENGTVLMTAPELISMAQLVQRQAQMLDQQEVDLRASHAGNPMEHMAMQAMSAHIAHLQQKLRVITVGTVVAVLWLSSIVVSVWLSR